jgi:hypothetical protein
MAYLWTPIANAVDSYRRRLLIEPKALYEHTWRLIHIHEALVVTLGTALATRLFTLWNEQPHTIAQDSIKTTTQKMITGLNPEDPTKPPSRGCLSGSISEWINLLNTAKNLSLNTDCPFIENLKNYIEKVPESPNNNSLAFLNDWERIAPVPRSYNKGDDLTVINRFLAINDLRNKLAHVPISARILTNLHKNLRKELLWLLTHDPNWLNDEDATKDIAIKKWHPSLCGQISDSKAFISGSTFGKASTDENHQNRKGVYWKWNLNNTSETITWEASPFVYFDDELKISLLFRVNNLSGDLDVNPTGEYHRFAAEVEPVQRRDISKDYIESWLPKKPSPESTEARDTLDTNDAIDTSESLKPDEISPEDLRTRAENAFKAGSYKKAVSYYDEMALKNFSNYTDVAKSRHGAALWRIANNISKEDKEIGKKNFLRAIDLLDQASNHRDIGYAAEAHYQKSKALWHLAEIDSENKENLVEQAKEEAEKALALALEQRYIGWYEWMLERTENIESETETYDSESDKLDSENSNDMN